ncbi:hypothetical protein F0562_005950 [Nyssa sinensis]|uniref:DUF668 domain-containing protein n=1 Tax=Nyssa sinensis TaxID=561372 RepID=A0A5J5AQ94_9ASTE|nr:hypothetical protein F0562_005950 [Nyssa sinensis]
MGGLCSKSTVSHKKNLYAGGRIDFYASGGGHQPNDLQLNKQSNLTHPQVRESMENQSQELKQLKEPISFREVSTTGYWSSDDDFYDGIPRYSRSLSRKSRSMRSKQGAVTKVSEVSSRLGRAGSAGLGKAVEVLDTLGSTVTNLNSGGGFVSGVTTKSNELSILAFEVANTIVKGSSLMQSLSKRSIRQLKEVVLPSEGVQNLVSEDLDELLRVVAADKREELKIFSGEVIRFGNRCKDPQWHNLDLFFEKHGRQLTSQKLLMEEADSVMEQLMTLVQCTADLYHELHTLDRYEEGYQRKRLEEYNPRAAQRVFLVGDSLAILRAELKNQRKQVKNLKKRSLWSRSLEEVMEKLVDIVLFLNREIHTVFGNADDDKHSIGSLSNQQRLGPAGLSMHYANIIIQIDTIVARSSSMPPNLRDTLYQSLPPSIKASLCSKLQSFRVKEELTVTEIKAEMEKTLHWLVPTATNTAKAIHGFGWVGEWANTGSEVNRRPTGPIDVIPIETLHHADKEKTEAYILDLVLWLNHLVNQSKVGANGGGMKSPIKSPSRSALQETNRQPIHEVTSALSSTLSVEEQEILQDVSNRKRTRGISKSQDFDSTKNRLRKHDRLSKSSNHSLASGSKEIFPVKRPSSIPVIDFSLDKERALDIIDRVDTHR